VAYSPDGRLIALGSIDNTASIWDAATVERLQTMYGHTAPVSVVAFSSDGKRLATSGVDATVRLWDVATGEELKRFSGHEDWVNTVAFGPGDTWLLTGSDDQTARIFDVASGAEVRRLEPGLGANAASFSTDGRRIVVATSDSYAIVYDANTGQELQTFNLKTGLGLGAAIFSPDGRLLVTNDWGSATINPENIYVWDATSGELLRRMSGHSGRPSGLAFSPDGRQLASCDSSATVIVWDTASWQALHVIKADADTRLCDVAFSPDGRYLAATGDPDGTANIWKVDALP